MPVISCGAGRWRIGSGLCIYRSKAKADRAYWGYLVAKGRESMATTSAGIAVRLRRRNRKTRKTQPPGMGLKFTMNASREDTGAFVKYAIERAMKQLLPESEMICNDPGKKRRSKGKGRGLGRGGGRGPVGRPYRS